MGASTACLPPTAAPAKELLEHLGLWDPRKDPVGTWSRGMKQKLAVARALSTAAAAIFLDEPTAGFDPVAAAALNEDLGALVRHQGVTVFLNTHNLAEAEQLCGTVGVIRQGRLIALGSPSDLRLHAGGPRAEVIGSGFDEALLTELRARPDVAGAEAQNGRLLLELRDGANMAPLVRLLVERGAEVQEVRKGAASLNQVFLALMEEQPA